MSKVSFLVMCLVAVVSMAVFSCKKQVDTELTGKWMKEAFVNSASDGDSAIWTFNNGTIYIENLTDSVLSDTGVYVVVEKNLKNYVRLDKLNKPLNHPDLNGDWRVIQYKKDKLTLAKPDRKPGTEEPSGNILREFTRIQ